MIDNIEYNMLQTTEEVKQGEVHTKSAVTNAKKVRKVSKLTRILNLSFNLKSNFSIS